MSQATVYFKNFNAIRFLAAFGVIFHHFMISNNLIDDSMLGEFALSIGKLSVVLFFTLSGFLITFLLLTEYEKNNSINIKHFYIRRILRIWPLYYFVVLLSLYFLNTNIFFRWVPMSDSIQHDFLIKNILYLFMLPNVGYAFGYHLPYADQTWSIGVEEQFYLFWPPLLFLFKNPAKPIISVIVVYLMVKVGLYYFNPFHHSLLTYWSILCFDVMALGGGAALIVFKFNRVNGSIFFNKLFIVLFLTIMISLLLFSVNFGVLHYEVYALFFCYLLIVLAKHNKKIPLFSSSIVDYLGKISFGLYMYHFIAIRVVYIFNYKFPLYSNPLSNFLLVTLTTIVISAISYEVLEKFFIKKKLRYSNVVSGDNVRSYVKQSSALNELPQDINHNAKLQSR